MSDEWRVQVELDDEGHGFTIGERIRALDLDDEARRRLGERVVVTRSGSHLFLYSGTAEGAEEAERVVRQLLEKDQLTAQVTTTRWHPVEEAWKDASIPLPESEEDVRAERERHAAAEVREVLEEGEFDWEVRVELDSRAEALALARRLAEEQLPITRRWKYVRVGALTEEQARELAERIRAEAPSGAVVEVEPHPADPADPIFVFLGAR